MTEHQFEELKKKNAERIQELDKAVENLCLKMGLLISTNEDLLNKLGSAYEELESIKSTFEDHLTLE